MKLSATSRATLDAWAKRGQGVAATSPLEIVNDAVRSGRLTHAKVRDALRKRRTKDDDDWDEGRKPNTGRAVLTLGTLRDALRKRRTRDGNFQKLEHSLAHENGVTDPAALAASIGRKKYGAAGMARKSEAGR